MIYSARIVGLRHYFLQSFPIFLIIPQVLFFSLVNCKSRAKVANDAPEIKSEQSIQFFALALVFKNHLHKSWTKSCGDERWIVRQGVEPGARFAWEAWIGYWINREVLRAGYTRDVQAIIRAGYNRNVLRAGYNREVFCVQATIETCCVQATIERCSACRLP